MRWLAVAALLALGTGSPAWAQDAGPTAAPAPSRPTFDEPPPLNLGTPPKPQPDALEAERKTRRERWREATRQAVMKDLSTNRNIRMARFDARLKLWIDSSGHVTRVELVQPTGDAELDAALRNEVLGLALPAPQGDTPMPFDVRIRLTGPPS